MDLLPRPLRPPCPRPPAQLLRMAPSVELPEVPALQGDLVNPYAVSRYLRQEVIVPLAQVFVSPEDIEDLGWQDRALCAQTDPDAFFPEKGGSMRQAKRVCRSCEVRAECLEYALEHDIRHGIWGGMSERERRRLKRQAA